MPRKTLRPPELFDSRSWGFSQVVVAEAGRIVHLAGQVAWDHEGNCNATTLEGQLRQALANVLIGLEAAGGTQADIQSLRLYIPNLRPGQDADLIARVLTDTFGTADPPASTWIGVQALAQPEYLVEIEAVAVLMPCVKIVKKRPGSRSRNG